MWKFMYSELDLLRDSSLREERKVYIYMNISAYERILSTAYTHIIMLKYEYGRRYSVKLHLH
jgi:hypothetical protein